MTVSDPMLRSCETCADAFVEVYDREKQSVDFFESRDLDAESPPPVVRFHSKLQVAIRRIFEVSPVFREIVGLLYQVQASFSL